MVRCTKTLTYLTQNCQKNELENFRETLILRSLQDFPHTFSPKKLSVSHLGNVCTIQFELTNVSCTKSNASPTHTHTHTHCTGVCAHRAMNKLHFWLKNIYAKHVKCGASNWCGTLLSPNRRIAQLQTMVRVAGTLHHLDEGS